MRCSRATRAQTVCQPHGHVIDVSCSRCGTGPLITGQPPELGDQPDAPALDRMHSRGWQLHPSNRSALMLCLSTPEAPGLDRRLSSLPIVARRSPHLQVVRPRFAAGAPPGPAAYPAAVWQRSRNAGACRRRRVPSEGAAGAGTKGRRATWCRRLGIGWSWLSPAGLHGERACRARR